MELDLVSRIKKKDESGLKSLYAAYGDVLYGNIFRICNNESVAQEILQTTFLKIWNNIEKFDSKKSGLYTWMNAIARNTTIDKLRLKGFQNNKKTKPLDSHVYNLNKSYVDNSNIDVERLLEKLEDKNRIILEKIYLEGYSHRDLAKELDLPLGTVKSRLRIAINILRDELKSEKNLFFGILLLLTFLILLGIL